MHLRLLAIQKTAEATGALIGNKIVYKNPSYSKITANEAHSNDVSN